MKTSISVRVFFVRVWLAFACLLTPIQTFGADKSDPNADLKALVDKISSKAKKGQRTEAALAPELEQFDSLLAKYHGQKTDDVAEILRVKAAFYAQAIGDEEKAVALLERLKADFPGTAPASKADRMIAGINQQMQAKQIKNTLAVGTKFPEFSEPDMSGKVVSLADYRGKVVLLDFWAIWCAPCIAELPNVLNAFEKYHAKGFEIIGISLDRAGETQKLIDFTKKRKMSWPQIYDGKQWQSKLVKQYGVNSIPATYLLDGEGTIIGVNLRGSALEREVARLINKK